MEFRNSSHVYGPISRLFHWATALLILFALPLGWYAVVIGARNVNPHLASLRGDLLFWHKSLGVSVLLLTTLRLGWIIYSPRPPLSYSLSVLERIGAKSVHYLLYGLLLGMPISGIILSQSVGYPVSFFGLFDLPTLVNIDHGIPALQRVGVKLGVLFHERIFAYVLYLSLILHIVGLVKHSFIDGDNAIWRRMGGRTSDRA